MLRGVRVLTDEHPHPCVRGIAKDIGDVGPMHGNVQLKMIRGYRQVSYVFCVLGHLCTQVSGTGGPGIQFGEEKDIERSAG